MSSSFGRHVTRKAGGELPISKAITIMLSVSAVTAWQAVVTATLGDTEVWSREVPALKQPQMEEGHCT